MTSKTRVVKLRHIRWLTYMMFLTFAMTTDAVGVVIPEVIDEFGLSLTQGGAFHYATMIAIALSGVFLGFLADKLGRKTAILIGLGLFTAASFLFAAGNDFLFFLALLALSGTAIGIFKTGALALIGDISTSSHQHTSTMNTVEGYFGVGAIIGPAIVIALLEAGWSWKFLYFIAGAVCIGLFIVASLIHYPEPKDPSGERPSLRRTMIVLKDPFALGFSCAIALYVATEVAIYVWMPTLLKGYKGDAVWVATSALTIFFVLRAGGRFLGAWVLSRFSWKSVMFVFSGAIFLCFAMSATFGMSAAIYLLPMSGLFMSMIYPTLNSKGISCFPKSQHGSVAGVILFFTAVAAAVGPLLMGAVGDLLGDVKYAFVLATAFAATLFLGMTYNLLKDPAAAIHAKVEQSEYGLGTLD